jgi:hypothetical protein
MRYIPDDHNPKLLVLLYIQSAALYPGSKSASEAGLHIEMRVPKVTIGFHRDGPGSSSGSGHERFVNKPSTSVSLAKHSADCSTLIILHHHLGLVQ